MHHQQLLLVFILVAGVSGAPIQDTAQIVIDRLTTFFTKDQLVSTLNKIGNDFYVQKENSAIASDAGERLYSLLTDQQKASLNTMNTNLQQGLGKGYQKVVNNLFNFLSRYFDKNVSISKQISAQQVKAGKTKVQAINAAWTEADRTMAAQIQNGMAAWKKTVTLNQWNAIKRALGPLFRFGLYP
ncbi:hypothetical protein M3Y95_00818500 [Aphelenchoides besseyi]|nr:hypothetical protein M3Y95_00818500 [Aphelenchoides besseyi]